MFRIENSHQFRLFCAILGFLIYEAFPPYSWELALLGIPLAAVFYGFAAFLEWLLAKLLSVG